jgi:type 1 fimbria pilin
MHRPRVLSLLAALLFLSGLAFPMASFAQTTADIVGRVTDSSGAVMPGATVTLENVGTRDLRTTVTTDTGDYVFTLLPIGTYTLKIEMQGFQTQTARAVLTSGDRTRIDGRLSVGSVAESVLVTADHCCRPTPRRSVPSSASRPSKICR